MFFVIQIKAPNIFKLANDYEVSFHKKHQIINIAIDVIIVIKQLVKNIYTILYILILIINKN